MAINEQGGVRIPIITYYSDKGVKAAASSLKGLEFTATKLAKTFGVTLGAAALVSFGKKSLDVFAKEQKAMAQLTNTLYNLGLAYDGIGVNQFLTDLQDATGVAKDELAPALQTLTTYTLSYAKSQELLNTALNVAAANQLDVGTVADALAKAYAGNSKALVSLGIGITATEAKTESFEQIMKQLNSTFKDAALVDNYKTRLDKLKVAATDAMSYIGQGIGEALNTLTADGNITKTMETLRNFGKVISEEIVGFAAGIKQLFKDISQIPLVKLVLSLGGAALKFLDKVLGISKTVREDINNFNKKAAADQAKADAKAKAAAEAQAKLNAKLRAQQLADQKKLNAEKAKQVALDKASLELKKASSIFDLEKIELAAASMSKQTAEDYARIKLKQDIIALQEAIDRGDAAAATKLAAIVEDDYKRVWAYQAQNIALGIQNGTITNIKNAAALIPTDLKLIDMDNLNAALKAIKDLIDALNKVPKVGGTNVTGSSKAPDLPPVFNPDGSMSPRGKNNIPSVESSAFELLTEAVDTLNKNTTALKPLTDSGFFDMAYNAAEFSGANINPYTLTDAQAKSYSQNQTITIVDNTSGLIQVVTDATQQATANGINTRLVRNTGSLNW